MGTAANVDQTLSNKTKDTRLLMARVWEKEIAPALDPNQILVFIFDGTGTDTCGTRGKDRGWCIAVVFLRQRKIVPGNASGFSMRK
jgi:hypothetical protein